MVMSGLALRSTAVCFLAWSAYIWPGLGSPEAVRLVVAWASVKDRDPFWGGGGGCLLEAVPRALARAALSAPYAMWVSIPAQDCPFCHIIEYLVAPSSGRDLSVNMVSPGRRFSASALASAHLPSAAPR